MEELDGLQRFGLLIIYLVPVWALGKIIDELKQMNENIRRLLEK